MQLIMNPVKNKKPAKYQIFSGLTICVYDQLFLTMKRRRHYSTVTDFARLRG